MNLHKIDVKDVLELEEKLVKNAKGIKVTNRTTIVCGVLLLVIALYKVYKKYGKGEEPIVEEAEAVAAEGNVQ